MLIMNKDTILKFLVDNLKVKIDRLQTSTGSSVPKKMNFLGLEFQAVPIGITISL